MKIKKGDEVRVVFRAEVLEVQASGPIDDENGHFGEAVQYKIRAPYDAIFITDEHIDKVYKNFEVGAVYRNPDGDLLKRTAWGDWLSFGDDEHYTDHDVLSSERNFIKVLDSAGFPV